jgi:multidrug efflux system membrane fusion protein
LRAFFSYGVAFIIIVVLGAWLATGHLIQGGQGPGKGERPVVALVEPKGGPITNSLEKSGVAAHGEDTTGQPDPTLSIAQREATTSGSTAPARSVQVKTFIAKPMAIEVPVRGQTKAKASVTAATETTGIVATVNVTKGQTVKVGDLLCTLDKGTRQAAVAQADAALAQAKVGVSRAQADSDTNAALRNKGLAASNTDRPLQVLLQSAKASQIADQAALDNAKQELDRTNIIAKSEGVVQDPLATVGSMLAAGSPCATVVQMNPILFTGSVPEARIGYARLGMPAKITTVTGTTIEGKVSYIASVADNATRSFPVEIELPNADGNVRSGVSATAVVNVGTAPAQLLPQSVLTLDDDGAMGIRAVENSKVVFYPVTIVKDAREGMYVTGLPAKLDVITVGQEFVKAGETVKAVEDTGTGAAAQAPATNGAQT